MNTSNEVAARCTMQHLPTGCPNNEWAPEELHAYAQSQHQAILDDERMLAVKYWRLGVALNLLRKSFDHGQWERQLAELNIEKTKASRARAIAKTYGSENDLVGLTVKQAYDGRIRKQRKQSQDAAKNDGEHHKLVRFLKNATKTIDDFMDYAGFAEASEAAPLLPAVEQTIRTLQQVHDLLRKQAWPDEVLSAAVSDEST